MKSLINYSISSLRHKTSYQLVSTTRRLLSNNQSMSQTASQDIITTTGGEDTDPKVMDNNSPTAAKRLKTDTDNDRNNGNSCETTATTDVNITSDTKTTTTTSGTVDKTQFKREKLRKWTLLLSYCGHKYYGMQRQTKDNEVPTIEYKLFEALHKSGIIGEDKLMGQHLCRFQRAARTDKGVSAIKQTVSLLLPQEFADQIPAVNQHLPDEIRLMGALRVTRSFDAKNYCDGRTYSYLMPSYTLAPIDAQTTDDYRITGDIIDEFNGILKMYHGTHNYHNFTSAKAPTDASAMRYIVTMDCSQPFLMSDNKLEFLVVRVRGQSFMLHQIRKMIGLAIAVMRGMTNKDTIIKAFANTRIDIPRAPGLGLLLEDVHYDKYNDKYGGDGIHEAILWDVQQPAVDEFKHRHIYPVIVDTERTERPMFEWLQTLILHTYDEREQKANQLLTKSDGNPVGNDDQLGHTSEYWKAHRMVNPKPIPEDLSNDKPINDNNCSKVEELFNKL